ncbi:MAG: putative molybdenum carrier protein [Desulfobacteraceae bacterium]
MSIKKVISGGQTGADQAALDAAIEMGVKHGGWVPLGRLTEKGRLPGRYKMQEINAIDYDQRTELNVMDSDGTLLFSHGKLAGGSALTKKLARKHLKPCLHVDIKVISEYKAVEIIKSWLEVRKIETLNVGGPRASESPVIYDTVLNIMKSVLYPPPEKIAVKQPKCVAEAVEALISTMSKKEMVAISRLAEADISYPSKNLTHFISKKFGLDTGNEDLLQSCMQISNSNDLDWAGAAAVIIRELWFKLHETHRLRVVK